jgi:hypothetical protein
MQEREPMEYDSRPKVKLFSFKDENEETKDLFFSSMKIMWILSAIAGLILGGLLFLADPAIGVITAIVVIAGVGFGTSYFNKKKEKYFTPLVTSIQAKLESQEISLTAEEVRELISQKEFRVSPKKILAVWSKDKEMSVFLIEDIKKVKEKTAKAKEFKVEVLSEVPADEIAGTEASEADEAVQGNKPEEADSASEDSLSENSTDTPEEEESEAEDTTKVKPKEPLKVIAVASQHASVDAVSTNAIDVVSPHVAGENSGKPFPAPMTGSIGLIAPGVTGPIPITVGDHSVPYTGLADHTDKGVEVNTEPVASSVAVEAPLRRPRHGRRSAAQQ